MNQIFESLFSLKDQVALLTGGGGGIGSGTAAMLASAGARIVLLDLDEAAAARAADAIHNAGGEAITIRCDITVPEEIAAAFKQAREAFGRIDILVNNAALVRRVPALDMSPAEWRKVMEVNLDAAFNCSCEAARHMPNGGSIINLASIMGVSGGGVYPIASYHASKGGLINLTRGLAVEWAEKRIRVNAVAPTWVKTEFTKALFEDKVVNEKLLALMPLGQFADVTDVAAAVLYLAAPAAKMVTGHVLAVDGGYLAR